MPHEARHALTGAALLATMVLVIQFQGFLYPPAFARWRASRVMAAHCKEWHMDMKRLVGPIRQQSPPGSWCFRWTYMGPPKGVMDVVLRRDGSSDLDGEQVD